MNRKCPKCRADAMNAEHGPFRYVAGGLPNVILRGVEVRRCASCGAETLSIPKIGQLHRAIAVALATKPSRLSPLEARFLRKYLGHSTVDLAAIMGVAPATITRWESVKSAQPIGSTSERLLRLMAVRDRPVEEYPSERLAEIDEEVKDATLRFEPDGGWHMAA